MRNFWLRRNALIYENKFLHPKQVLLTTVQQLETYQEVAEKGGVAVQFSGKNLNTKKGKN